MNIQSALFEVSQGLYDNPLNTEKVSGEELSHELLSPGTLATLGVGRYIFETRTPVACDAGGMYDYNYPPFDFSNQIEGMDVRQENDEVIIPVGAPQRAEPIQRFRTLTLPVYSPLSDVAPYCAGRNPE